MKSLEGDGLYPTGLEFQAGVADGKWVRSQQIAAMLRGRAAHALTDGLRAVYTELAEEIERGLS